MSADTKSIPTAQTSQTGKIPENFASLIHYASRRTDLEARGLADFRPAQALGKFLYERLCGEAAASSDMSAPARQIEVAGAVLLLLRLGERMASDPALEPWFRNEQALATLISGKFPDKDYLRGNIARNLVRVLTLAPAWLLQADDDWSRPLAFLFLPAANSKMPPVLGQRIQARLVEEGLLAPGAQPHADKEILSRQVLEAGICLLGQILPHGFPIIDHQFSVTERTSFVRTLLDSLEQGFSGARAVLSEHIINHYLGAFSHCQKRRDIPGYLVHMREIHELDLYKGLIQKNRGSKFRLIPEAEILKSLLSFLESPPPASDKAEAAAHYLWLACHGHWAGETGTASLSADALAVLGKLTDMRDKNGKTEAGRVAADALGELHRQFGPKIFAALEQHIPANVTPISRKPEKTSVQLAETKVRL
ncbi:MAG: hypothetical protein M3O22_04420 [Pseudomonadota bacterium]|nr:hypothetical protein [Pseudomonadota bacterium]